MRKTANERLVLIGTPTSRVPVLTNDLYVDFVVRFDHAGVILHNLRGSLLSGHAHVVAAGLANRVLRDNLSFVDLAAVALDDRRRSKKRLRVFNRVHDL